MRIWIAISLIRSPFHRELRSSSILFSNLSKTAPTFNERSISNDPSNFLGEKNFFRKGIFDAKEEEEEEIEWKGSWERFGQRVRKAKNLDSES